jgi:hypothetical protein
MRTALGIVGGIGALVLTGLAASYGYSTAPDPLAGAGIAFFYAFVATVGMGGPAAVVYFANHTHGWAKFGAVPLAVVVLAAMFGNFTNSLGALVSRSDAQTALRSRVTDAGRNDRAQLERMMRDRAAMVFTPATAETVTAARDALTTAERSRAAECGNGDPKQRGKNCRDREGDERTAAEALSAATLAKAATDRAAQLDGEIAALRARMAMAPAVASVNPLGDALERILSIPASEAATWQQGYLVFVAELATACLLAAWEALRGIPSPARREVEVLVQTTPTPAVGSQKRPTMVASVDLSPAPRPEGTGSVASFMLACLPRARGKDEPLTVVYARYYRWCAEQTPSVSSESASAFAEQFRTLCDRFGVRTEKRGGKVYLLGVRLVA